MTPLKLLINGVDRTAWLANGYSIDIEKVLSTETFHLAILDLDSTAGALRPSVGDAILLTRTDEAGDDIELLFGGAIADVTDEPIIDDSGTVTRIRCRDQMVLADQVFMPPRTYEAAPVREVFTAIVEEYLGPKGVVVISDPTGGPPLPELRIDDFVTTVRQTLDRITLQCGWPWRINGEKAAGIIEPGELVGPAALADDGASVLTDPPLRWQQQVLTHATRVFVQTSAPEAGPGPVMYTETTTPPSGTSVVPVHVLPTEIHGATSADAAIGATSLSLQSLPKDASIRIGALLTIDTHTRVYTLTSATTTNADGEATVALDAGISADVKDGTSVIFLRGSFVQLELNGVVTPMDGAPYVWEPIENAIVYPAGDLGGMVVGYRTWVLHPTMVREWDPVAQQAIGWFDYAAVIDQQITEEEGHTDFSGARAFARAELAKRLAPPKRVTCTTRIPGHYPLLIVPMAFPDRLVTGNYLVTETRIRHSTIDENADEQPLLYELVLMEGDALGDSWIQYFRGRNPSQGIRWGGLGEVLLSQAVIEVMLLAQLAKVSQAVVETMIQPDAVARLSQAVIEVLITGSGGGGGPALPSTSRTLHVDASVASDLYTTFVSGGPHTGTPSDGSEIEVWADASGAARIFKKSGASGTPNLRSSTPLMPLQCVDFTGGERLILTNHSGTNQVLSTLINASSWTLLVSFYAEAITDSAGSSYNNHAVIADTSGYWGIYLRVSGGVKKVTVFVWDAGEKGVTLNCSDSATHVLMARHESGTLYASLDGGAETSSTVGSVDNVGGDVGVGIAYGPGSGLNGRIGEIAIWNVALTGTDLSDALGYFTTKWLP